MLLINPPVAKPSEPPAGITRLAGTLKANGYPCQLLDAGLEGLLFLLNNPAIAKDTWSKRAARNCVDNLNTLRTSELYQNHDRYNRAVTDLNRMLENSGKEKNVLLSLSNYQDQKLSPLKSSDLKKAANEYEENLFFPYFSERLAELIDLENTHFIGISLNYLSQALTTFAIAGFIRKRYPDITIVMGGGLITSWLKNPRWENPFADLIDHLVEGPGEGPLLKLLGADAPTIEHPPDIYTLPLNDYLSPGLILPYAASSGCYWNKCSFCPENAEANPYLPLNNNRVRSEISNLVDEYKPNLIHFLDNAISPALLKNLAADPPGADWYGFCRFEKILADPEFCHSLKDSGCVMVKLGLESGDQNVLDKLDKGIDLKMVSTVLKNLKDAGIATYIYLLFGTPVEDFASARKTMEFIAEHADAVTFLNLAIFNMPVGSPEAKDLAIADFYEGDLSIYTDFKHPADWNRKEIRKFLDREFKRHPVIAEIIRRDPSFFTSNHAPFFSI